MRPHKITATGIKTGGISLALSPLTLVVGDNGSGKTAIADAVRLGFLGYHPTLGKKSSEIMKLANGDVLEVDIDGIRRTWTRKGKTVSHESNEGATALDEKPGFSPVILDFESFLNAKATGRREILEAVLPAINPTEILQEINRKLTEAGIEDQFEETPSDFVTLTKGLGDKGKEWKQEAARLKGLVQSLGIELSEVGAVTSDVPASPESFAARRDEILKIKTEAESALKRFEDAVRDAPTKPAGVRVTPEGVEALKDALAAEKAQSDKNTKTEARNREIRTELVNLTVDREKTFLFSPEGTSLTRPDLDRDPNFADTIKAFASKLAGIDREIATETESLRTKNARKVELEAEIGKLAESGTCPTCGTCGEGLEEAVGNILRPAVSDVEDLIKITTGKIEALKDDRAIAEKDRDSAEDHEGFWKAFDGAKDRQAIDEKISAAKLDFAETEPDRYDETLEDLRRAEVALELWSKWVLASPVEGNVEELNSAVSAAQINLDDVDRNIQVAKNRQALDLKIANLHASSKTSKAELKTAEENVKEIKALGEWSKSRSLEVTSARLAPLLDPANSILAGVVPGSLAIEGTDVGLKTEEGFRSIEVLSGAESAAVAAAIQVALAASGSLPFVIIDELSRLTPPRKKSLIANVFSAIESKLIDGAMILDHDASIGDNVQAPDVLVHTVSR